MNEPCGSVPILCLVLSGMGAHHSLENLDSSPHSPAPSRALLNWLMARFAVACGCGSWMAQLTLKGS